MSKSEFYRPPLSFVSGATQGSQFAFDPISQPWLFDGVRTRRILAFFLDLIVLSIFIGVAMVAVGLFGLLTLGLGWLLYLILVPAIAILYIGLTMGGPKSATPGMQAMGIEMRLWYGDRMNGLVAIVHALIFYFSWGTGLLGFIIIGASLFSSTKQCLHDLLLGTVVINNEGRAASLRA
ncbi:MAG: RDD family protein [Pseudomonadota bacterium]